ncbi:unnamed protein product [Bursaphelenchus okinawaensis]|uniref:Uncharacterized protein n=1 Tax=Bursaphelenchus okinawaensis TaxID=465554 RepID=A0A811KCN1_9BILA|nr:unnamed protein product [Bursaphelenchus okinawaensis]CAG9098999.1 unnamed protein product [Bursaphelenchus okinawaensis]
MADLLKKVKSKLFKHKKAKKERNEIKTSTPQINRTAVRLIREYEDVRSKVETPKKYSQLFKPATVRRLKTKSVAMGEDLDYVDSDSDDYSFVRNSAKRVSFNPHVRDDEVDALRAKYYKLERDFAVAQRQLQNNTRRSIRFQRLYKAEKENKRHLERENKLLKKSFVDLVDRTFNQSDSSMEFYETANTTCTAGAPEGMVDANVSETLLQL